MPQINLLKQQSSGQNFVKLLPSLLAKLLAFLVLVLIGYYAWLWYQVGSVDKQIKDVQTEFSKTEEKVVTVSNRNEVYTRQAQILQYKALISKHLYWSNLLPALARITLKKAWYTSLSADRDGVLKITVNVPDMDSLDKFIQIFNEPDYNTNFNNLVIGQFQLVQKDKQQYFSFDASLKFNTALLNSEKSN